MQTEVERWQYCGILANAEAMHILAKKHIELVNPSGKAWSRVLARGHDEVDKGPEEPTLDPATKVQCTQGEPETKEELITATGSCETITSAEGTYDLITTRSRHLCTD